MKLFRRAPKAPSLAKHGEAAILFAIGAFTFLIAAEEVDEIREMYGMESVSIITMRTSVAKVTNTIEKAKQTYYVVDGSQHFHMMPSKAARLMLLRNQTVAVTVDSIDRMTEIGRVLPLPKAFVGPERDWYRGLAIENDKVVPVVNGGAFLTDAEQVIARSALSAVGRGTRA